jgi:hypothetical protein
VALKVKEGREDVKDDERTGCPKTHRTPQICLTLPDTLSVERSLTPDSFSLASCIRSKAMFLQNKEPSINTYAA